MFNADMNTTPLHTRPYRLNDDKQAFLFLGLQVSINASTEQTGGAFNLFELRCPVDYETPLHILYAEDVAIYVLDGALEVFWGTEKMKAPVGSYFFQPRGTPYGFRVAGELPARILYLSMPAGFDQFMDECIKSGDRGEMIAAAHHKIEILGPLPVTNTKKENQND